MQIKEVFLKSVQLKAKIIVFPEDKVEEELNCPALAAENGLIPKTFYEDVILQICVANFMQLTLEIHQHPSLIENLLEFKQELLKFIYELNPKFKPESIFITRTGKLTLIPNDNCIRLIENKVWNDVIPDVLGKAFDNLEENEVTDGFFGTLDLENPFSDLEYEIIPKWWERLKGYVKIKKFSEEDCELILNNEYPDRAAFEANVVVACVEDFEELYKTIEFYGLPKRVPPPVLLHELYILCSKVNPSLTFNGSATMGAASGSSQPTTKTKKQKLFKDVSEEALLKLADKIKQKVVGQDHAVDKVVEAIKRAKVGLKEADSPIGTFIFTGFSGSGKTYLSKVLAEELIGSKDHLIRIDCSEYSADHEYAKLIGAPNGYIGFEQGGILTNAVAEKPFSVVLFDEVEKASSKVHQLMLQIMDDGILTDNKGNKVSFSDVIIIMTSNIGVEELDRLDKTPGFITNAITDKRKNVALDEAIKKKFKPEFINRIDEIVHFNMLTNDDYKKIVDLELSKVLNLLFSSTNIEIVYNDLVREFLLEKGIDNKYGARPLKRCIKKHFSNPLADEILKGNIKSKDKVKADVMEGKIVFNKISKKAPFYLSKKGRKCLCKVS